jgi:hypothetical protein
LIASVAHGQVSFQWVTVGNPGNAADPQTMTKTYSGLGIQNNTYGAVSYTFQISKYDVTDTQYVSFLNTVDPTGSNSLGLYTYQMTSIPMGQPDYGTDYVGGLNYNSAAANGSKYSVKAGYANQPATWINWNDAARFTNWYANGQGAGGTETGVYNMSSTAWSGVGAAPTTIPTRAANAKVFLPNMDEYQKAAYYNPTLNGGAGGYYQYATQSNTAPVRGAPPGGPNTQNYDLSDYAYPSTSTNYVTDVGAYVNAPSYYGAYDMDDNVENWTENFVNNPIPYNPSANNPGGVLPLYRGGNWNDPSYYQGAAWAGSYSFASSTSYNWFGFRLAMLPTATIANGTWNVDSAGNWSTAGSWSGSVPNGTDAIATFGNAITAGRSITVDSAQTVGTLNFNSSSAYTIAGSSTLSLNVSTGQATINVSAGSHSISAPLAPLVNTSINITPSGSTLTLSNLQSSAIILTVSGAGTLAVNNLRTSSLNISSGTVSVIASGTNASTSVLNGLNISSGATLNLNNNALILHGPTLAQVNALLTSGYNAGHWNGSGISTAMASNITALGVMLNNNGSGGAIVSPFEGQPTSVNDVLVKYTYYGDTNLDGQVNSADYAVVDNGYLNHLTGWSNGDSNYDNVINGSDYTLIDNAFNTQGATISSIIASPGAAIAAEIAPVSAVPEPASLGIVSLGALYSLRRRRR